MNTATNATNANSSSLPYMKTPAAMPTLTQDQQTLWNGRDSMTVSMLISESIDEFISTYPAGSPVTPKEAEAIVLGSLRLKIVAVNATRSVAGIEKLRMLTGLTPDMIARLVAHLQPVCIVDTLNRGTIDEDAPIALYQASGPYAGTYRSEMTRFRTLFRKYNSQLNDMQVKACYTALQDVLFEQGKVRKVCRDRNLIAVNNGIFDYRTKQLMPFSPDYVFLSKSRVNYNPLARNVVIHNPNDGTDWDVESWMDELSDDPAIVKLLWEVLGAIIRPNVNWDHTVWLYSTTGNNGKGTLCELMRQLCGDGSYVSLPISDMGKNFALEPLLNASAIITDENDVGTFIDKAANLKSLVTGDAVSIDRKFKVPVTFVFMGLMVQCLNEMPRIKDKTGSFWRRMIFIPFDKCFTGHERRYIKHDYLGRKEVLEYVLKRVLDSDYYELSEPAACKAALEDYKLNNDPVRAFAAYLFADARWGFFPKELAYDIYKRWFKDEYPNGIMQSKRSFIADLDAVIEQSGEMAGWNGSWTHSGRGVNALYVPVGKYELCSGSEPLVEEGFPNDTQRDLYKIWRDYGRNAAIDKSFRARGYYRTSLRADAFADTDRLVDRAYAEANPKLVWWYPSADGTCYWYRR